VQDRGGDFRENCPSTPAVPVKVLLEPDEADDAAIEKMLKDGIVLYGAYFRGAVDVVNTPLHNDLRPSLALDRTRQPDHPRPDGPCVTPSRKFRFLAVALPDFALLVLIVRSSPCGVRAAGLTPGGRRSCGGVRSRVGRLRSSFLAARSAC